MLPPLLAAVLDGYLRDWIDLLVRWLHVIAAIGWIGSSFYFVLLDQSLRRPREVADEEAGVAGELWEVHGGGFYQVQKYRVAPAELPDHLAWFKWEAYATWTSGFVLLVALYWLDARTYMVDPQVADLSSWEAVGVSAGLIVASWLAYDLLCRALRGRERMLIGWLVVGIVLAAWATGELFSPRAAWLQVGAMLGTIMAGSVLFNIIPAHRELIRAKEEGREPDPAPGIEAKRRSVHNNYFTLPVLITMLAGHFTFLTAHEHAWLVLVALMALGAYARHFYNLRHAGRTHWWMPAVAAVAVLVLFFALEPDAPTATGAGDAGSASAEQLERGRTVFADAGCGDCHVLADAGSTGTSGPNLDSAGPSAELVRARVAHGKGGMPAFSGRLDEREIDAVAAYVADAAGSH